MRKSSILAKNILKDYKREKAMKKRLQKMSDKKMGFKEVKNEIFNSNTKLQ